MQLPRADGTSGIRSVFVAAPFGQVPGAVESALRRQGLGVSSAVNLPLSSMSSTDAVSAAIRESDIVIGVVDVIPEGNVLFELGIARGLGKRILLIAPSTTPIPSDLRGISRISASTGDSFAIEYGLRQIIKAPPLRIGLPSIGASVPIGFQASTLLVELEAAISVADEKLVVDVVRRALDAAGLVVEAQAKSKGFDLAVWSDELESTVGNPVLIEVNIAFIHPWPVVADVMGQVMHGAGRFALLLFATPGGASMDESALKSGGGVVAALDVREFVRRLEFKTFPQVVRELRNRAVHGL